MATDAPKHVKPIYTPPGAHAHASQAATRSHASGPQYTDMWRPDPADSARLATLLQKDRRFTITSATGSGAPVQRAPSLYSQRAAKSIFDAPSPQPAKPVHSSGPYSLPTGTRETPAPNVATLEDAARRAAAARISQIGVPTQSYVPSRSTKSSEPITATSGAATASRRVLLEHQERSKRERLAREKEQAEFAQKHEILISAALRNVNSSLGAIDKDIRDNTLWGNKEFIAAATAHAEQQITGKYSANVGKVDLGGGLIMTPEEVHAIAQRHVQPVLDELHEKALEQREQDEIARQERERIKAEKAEEKRIHKEEKAEEKRIRQEERAAEKARRAEEKRVRDAEKAEEKRIRDEEKAEQRRIRDEEKAEQRRIKEEAKAEERRLKEEAKAAEREQKAAAAEALQREKEAAEKEAAEKEIAEKEAATAATATGAEATEASDAEGIDTVAVDEIPAAEDKDVIAPTDNDLEITTDPAAAAIATASAVAVAKAAAEAVTAEQSKATTTDTVDLDSTAVESTTAASGIEAADKGLYSAVPETESISASDIEDATVETAAAVRVPSSEYTNVDGVIKDVKSSPTFEKLTATPAAENTEGASIASAAASTTAIVNGIRGGDVSDPVGITGEGSQVSQVPGIASEVSPVDDDATPVAEGDVNGEEHAADLAETEVSKSAAVDSDVVDASEGSTIQTESDEPAKAASYGGIAEALANAIKDAKAANVP